MVDYIYINLKSHIQNIILIYIDLHIVVLIFSISFFNGLACLQAPPKRSRSVVTIDSEPKVLQETDTGSRLLEESCTLPRVTGLQARTWIHHVDCFFCEKETTSWRAHADSDPPLSWKSKARSWTCRLEELLKEGIWDTTRTSSFRTMLLNGMPNMQVLCNENSKV